MRRARNVHPVSTPCLREAAARLRRGDLVAFPTETVYGLGANALDEKAVAKIFAAKGRPQDNPVIVHVSDRRMLRRVIRRLPPLAMRLADRFWPGPLTLVLSKKSSISSLLTGGLDTVAVRMPQGLARDIVRLAGVPIAAPSANLSGRPSPTTAAHVAEDFPDVFVLDGGPTKHGVESTVVAFDPHPMVLRHGAVTEESLRKMIPELGRAASIRPRSPGGGAVSLKVEEPVVRRRRGSTVDAAADFPNSLSKKIFRASSDAARSPGTKYKHYAPSRPLILFRRKEDLAAYFASHPQSLVLGPASLSSLFPKQRFLSLGNSSEEIARALFGALRTRRRGTELLALAIPRRGIGRAVMDRLTRAATRVVP